MTAEQLKALLDYHDYLYYDLDSPVLDDEEYNTLKRRYLKLIGKDEYDYVPGSALFNKVKHPNPILSLDKVQITDVDKLRAEIARLWPVVIEPKFDGLTLVAYPDGTFVTRGNGKIGEDVTQNAKQIYCLEDISPWKHAYRMEVLMPFSEFDRINQKRAEAGKELYKTPRNAAAGMLRNKDGDKIEGLTAFLYELIGSDTPQSQFLYEFSEQGCDILTPYWKFPGVLTKTKEEGIEEALNFILNFDRTILDYDIDGLVIKSDIRNSLEEFGMTGHHPKNAIAVKFEAEGAWTQIIDIIWQVGKTGAITPVALYEPVELGGATFERATMHNIAIMHGLGLDRILCDNNNKTFAKIIRSNDVIPKCVEIKHENPDGASCYSKPVRTPDVCPVCGAATEMRNDLLYCTGNSCEAQLAGKIAQLASRDALNMVGLSEATIDKMIVYAKEREWPLNFVLPFLFSEQDILALPGFAPVSAKKLYNTIQGARQTELNRFIYAANIPLIGRSASELIANEVRTLSRLVDIIMENKYHVIKDIDGIGDIMIEQIKKYAQANFFELYNYVQPIDMPVVPEKKKLAKEDVITFVITGSFDIPRKEIETNIKNAGHKVSGSVSKKTNYLLAAPGEEGTAKYAAAKENGTIIINTLIELGEVING